MHRSGLYLGVESKSAGRIVFGPVFAVKRDHRARRGFGCPIGSEDSVPEEVDHGKVFVRVPMMHEMQLLLAPEPCKPSKPGAFHMIFPIEKDVRVETRLRTRQPVQGRI